MFCFDIVMGMTNVVVLQESKKIICMHYRCNILLHLRKNNPYPLAFLLTSFSFWSFLPTRHCYSAIGRATVACVHMLNCSVTRYIYIPNLPLFICNVIFSRCYKKNEKQIWNVHIRSVYWRRSKLQLYQYIHFFLLF